MFNEKKWVQILLILENYQYLFILYIYAKNQLKLVMKTVTVRAKNNLIINDKKKWYYY